MAHARRCDNCDIACGVLIEQCYDCENFGMIDEVYDSETEDFVVILPAAPKINKRRLGLSPKELEEKRQRVEQQNKRREEKIQKAREENEKKRAEKRKSELFMSKEEKKRLSAGEATEQEILESLIDSIPKGRVLKSPIAAPEYQSRGPCKISELKPFIPYTKPIGYFSIPLKVNDPSGDWLGCSGSANEWIVAFHGTSLSAVESILKGGFRAGPGQACKSNSNQNPISDKGPVGEGIYCSPYISTAEGYNKSQRYTCILQCRVSPHHLKVATSQNWVVNRSQHIRPYKLLIRPRYPR